MRVEIVLVSMYDEKFFRSQCQKLHDYLKCVYVLYLYIIFYMVWSTILRNKSAVHFNLD